ncbi:unnamed protein product [Closterium sp. NIES-64]|nr:unnamed protein product [Closterium sp. NIES-64]
MAGSAYYIAPEVLNNCYGLEADMWSVGVILYILLCGLPPFWAEKEEGIFAAIKTGKIDVFTGVWEGVSQDAKDLVIKLLTRDPSKRITPEKALGLREGVFTGVWEGVFTGVLEGVFTGVWEGVFTGVWEGVFTGLWEGVWEFVSQDAKYLVIKLLTRDPSKRITPDKALGEWRVVVGGWVAQLAFLPPPPSLNFIFSPPLVEAARGGSSFPLLLPPLWDPTLSQLKIKILYSPPLLFPSSTPPPLPIPSTAPLFPSSTPPSPLSPPCAAHRWLKQHAGATRFPSSASLSGIPPKPATADVMGAFRRDSSVSSSTGGGARPSSSSGAGAGGGGGGGGAHHHHHAGGGGVGGLAGVLAGGDSSLLSKAILSLKKVGRAAGGAGLPPPIVPRSRSVGMSRSGSLSGAESDADGAAGKDRRSASARHGSGLVGADDETSEAALQAFLAAAREVLRKDGGEGGGGGAGGEERLAKLLAKLEATGGGGGGREDRPGLPRGGSTGGGGAAGRPKLPPSRSTRDASDHEGDDDGRRIRKEVKLPSSASVSAADAGSKLLRHRERERERDGKEKDGEDTWKKGEEEEPVRPKRTLRRGLSSASVSFDPEVDGGEKGGGEAGEKERERVGRESRESRSGSSAKGRDLERSPSPPPASSAAAPGAASDESHDEKEGAGEDGGAGAKGGAAGARGMSRVSDKAKSAKERLEGNSLFRHKSTNVSALVPVWDGREGRDGRDGREGREGREGRDGSARGGGGARPVSPLLDESSRSRPSNRGGIGAPPSPTASVSSRAGGGGRRVSATNGLVRRKSADVGKLLEDLGGDGGKDAGRDGAESTSSGGRKSAASGGSSASRRRPSRDFDDLARTGGVVFSVSAGGGLSPLKAPKMVAPWKGDENGEEGDGGGLPRNASRSSAAGGGARSKGSGGLARFKSADVSAMLK